MSRAMYSIGLVQVLVVLVSLVRSKTLSVFLGPAGFGVVSTIDQVVVTVVSLSSLSLPFTALKFMARSHSEGEERFRQTYSAFLRVLGSLALGATLIASGLLLWWPEVFGPDLAQYSGFLHIALLTVPAFMLNILFVNTLAAAQRPSASAILSLVVGFTLAAAAITGALTHGIDGLYIAVLSAGVVTTIGSALHVRRSLHLGAATQQAGLLQELRRSPGIARVSALLWVMMSAYALTMLGARYFVFSRMGEADAGLLQALMSLALTVSAVLTPMNNLYLTPLVNRALPVHEKARAADDFARRMVLVLLAASLPLVLFPGLTLTLLFSSRFTPCAPALFVFILWQSLYQIVNIYQQLLIGLDDVAFVTWTAASAYAVTAALFPVLIPQSGLTGAALALATGVAIVGIAAATRLRTRFATGVARGIWVRIGLCLGAITAAGLLFRGSDELTPGGIGGRLAFAVGALALAWAALTREERDWLLALAGRPPRP